MDYIENETDLYRNALDAQVHFEIGWVVFNLLLCMLVELEENLSDLFGFLSFIRERNMMAGEQMCGVVESSSLLSWW